MNSTPANQKARRILAVTMSSLAVVAYLLLVILFLSSEAERPKQPFRSYMEDYTSGDLSRMNLE